MSLSWIICNLNTSCLISVIYCTLNQLLLSLGFQIKPRFSLCLCKGYRRPHGELVCGSGYNLRLGKSEEKLGEGSLISNTLFLNMG